VESRFEAEAAAIEAGWAEGEAERKAA